MKVENSLQTIPGVGKSIAKDLQNIGIYSVDDLKGKNPKMLYEASNLYAGKVQDRCLLYVLRTAVYFAENKNPEPEKLKWWKSPDFHHPGPIQQTNQGKLKCNP